VSPRRRDQRGETAEQLARLENEDLAAVAEAPLHAVGELAVGERGRPLLRERWAGAIALLRITSWSWARAIATRMKSDCFERPAGLCALADSGDE